MLNRPHAYHTNIRGFLTDCPNSRLANSYGATTLTHDLQIVMAQIHPWIPDVPLLNFAPKEAPIVAPSHTGATH